MGNKLKTRLRWCICLAVLAVPLCAQVPVHYELSFPNAVHHEAEVRAVFSGVQTPLLEVVMSRSSPGRYALHEFVKNVYHVRAIDSTGHPLVITKLNPYGWTVAASADKTVIFEYTVFGDHADGTYNGIDETHAHLNMPATLAWAHGFENVKTTVRFDLRERKDWKVATQMLPQSDGDWGAPNLEWLMDCPVEISKHALLEWKIENATFRLSLHHKGTAEEAERYARMCKAVVLEEEGVFGALPKYDAGTYTFLIDYLPYASPDGMEHRNSTFITDTGSLSDGANRLIDAVSHEFFHSWNVRRMRPKSLEPFDLERANMSGELWFAEGFTNYYGVLALERAGLSTLDEFRQSMGGAVNRVLSAPGRKVHSAVGMSELAPFVDAATSIDPNNYRNTYISYYTYGQALALGIDLAIRERFTGKSLDDWMRVVWHRNPDIDKPYTLTDLQTALAEATGDPAFAEDMFRRHIQGMEPINYADLLAPAGMLLRKAHEHTAWWGNPDMTISENGAELKSESVRETPLYAAGLGRGDRILEIGGKKIKADAEVKDLLSNRAPGDTVRVKVITRGGEREVRIKLAEDPQLELITFEQASQDVPSAAESFRKAWLGSKALHPLPDIN